MRYEYKSDIDETHASINGTVFAEMEGKIQYWRNNVPHPETAAFETFADGLVELDSPTEAEVTLHLLAGEVEQIGFE